ncbi:CinA family protein [Caulobacter sp. UC70_42]|uniref:CinA family protein n=1 Tax=Caulobacter sp. UC70_42 TaxID=3374551 RepID=UPI003756A34C
MAEALDPILTPELDALTCCVLEKACAQGLKLGTAESCTGGLLASLLTDVPGCSHAFERGFVVYSEDAKHDLLGVPRDMLEAGGAVSQGVALAMASGALARSRADIVLAVTGWAEDMGDPQKPGGLVHFACASRDRPTHHRKAELGVIGRQAFRLACLEIAMDMLFVAVSL